ncbi:LysM peptidoglycan-binding domain-containing protein [Terrabacter sp. Ter38]|uniref:LysM peptidoglycan-binding domain-containing protein n=1 Tax=Terrabacter sp. Ter38 TaxID=2926030 RepID=UPI00211820E1|nr:LysM peptidoglycan-binding domain-containing protein [Terrabacter sp. Ter38]
MSAIVLEAVRQPHTEEPARSRPTGRPRLVLVPTGPEAARAARPPMRLTRFGRLVVTLLVAGVVSVLGVGLAGQLASATGEPRTVTVQAGQTLSGIAARELPELTPAQGVVELQIANALSTTSIHAGQQIVVPSR